MYRAAIVAPPGLGKTPWCVNQKVKFKPEVALNPKHPNHESFMALTGVITYVYKVPISLSGWECLVKILPTKTIRLFKFSELELIE